MTCREATDFLLDYVAGELPAETLTAFERHLDRCANCRAFLSQYRTTLAAAKRSGAPDVDRPIALPDDLLQAILNTLARQP